MALRRTALPAFLLALPLGGAAALASPPPPAPPISGIVSHMEKPISGALVIFYNLGDTTLTRSRTSFDGTFLLASAPVGVYDLIAYKRGFVPSLVRFWHQALPDGVSAVHIQLAAKAPIPQGASRDSSLWELRDRLPADVLREISLEEAGETSPTAGDRPRLGRSVGGEVRTVTNVASNDTSLSRAAVGVRGGLPNGWQYDLRGDYAAVSENAVSSSSDGSSTTGNVAGLALDVSTSPDDHLTLLTRRHTLSFHDDRPASLQTHTVAWSRNDEQGSLESVAARYVEETNLYRATSAGTSFFPLASRTWEVKARYARPATDSPGVAVGMTYRHREGTIGANGVGSDGALLLSAPDADLSASASARISSRAEIEAGVIARYLGGGYGIAPVAGVRYDMDDHTTVFVRGLLRARESRTGAGTALPLVASVEENSEATARKGFTVGVESRDGNQTSVRLEASNQRVSEAVRAFFEGDFLTDFDSIYLFDGNLVRQYRAVGTHRLSDKVSASVSGQYGSIDSSIAPSAAGYGVTSNHGHFWSARAAVELIPTRTGVAILVRGARQKLETAAAPRSNDSDKVAVSLAQDLSVVGITPFGSVCKLLVALESGRSTATAERDELVATKRLLGGLAISF